jgi:hypothetical protein
MTFQKSVFGIESKNKQKSQQKDILQYFIATNRWENCENVNFVHMKLLLPSLKNFFSHELLKMWDWSSCWWNYLILTLL